MEILILIVLVLACLTWMFMYIQRANNVEGYMDFIEPTETTTVSGLGSGMNDDLARVDQGLPLSDILVPRTQGGLSALDAASCAALDPSRNLEVGGQYVQRTNNYKRAYPDSCSSLPTEFVGAVYEPPGFGSH